MLEALPPGALATLPSLNPRWRQAVAAYLAEVAARTGSARTPVEYTRLLARFLDRVGSPEAATPANVHGFAYGTGPSGHPPSASTVNVRLAAVSGFYDFARRMGLASGNPAAEVKRPRVPAAAPRGLSMAEVRRLLAAVPETPSGLRDRAVIITAVLTGLRRSELLALRVGDLSLDDGVVYYRVRTKGGVERHRELPRPAVEAIRVASLAAGRALDGRAPDEPLFAISGRGFAANLARYGRHAGLPGLRPHTLRHGAAKLRRETGASIEDVQSLLGHANLATTARYLARLEGDRDPGWAAVAFGLGL